MEDQLSPSLGQDLDLSAAHVEEKKKKAICFWFAICLQGINIG